jgi:hypothetical protein
VSADPASPAAGAQAAAPIAAAAIDVNDSTVAEMEHAILGDFDVHNSEIAGFDLADIEIREYKTLSGCRGNLGNYTREEPGKIRKNTPLLTGEAKRPQALFAFIQRHHPDCAEIADQFALDTNPTASVYMAHTEILQREFEKDFLDYHLGNKISGHFQHDCSRIVKGNDRTTCVSSSPTQIGNPEVFLRALALELGDNDSGLIVGIDKNEYFKDETDGLTGVEEVTNMDVSTRGLWIRSGKVIGKDGKEKTIYHITISGWVDNTALPPERILKINEEIENLCRTKGIKMVNMHCGGGLGRAPTLCVANAIEQVARKAQEMGADCCCDWDQQTERVVDGKVNLAYVARNLILKGLATRSTFLQVAAQFEFFKNFTPMVAQKYGRGSA